MKITSNEVFQTHNLRRWQRQQYAARRNLLRQFDEKQHDGPLEPLVLDRLGSLRWLGWALAIAGFGYLYHIM